MKQKSPETSSWGPKKFMTIAEGTASYIAYERDYRLDLKAAWEAYKDALRNAKIWISEFKIDLQDSAKVYKTEYLGPAKKTNLHMQSGPTRFSVKQKIKVSVKEITNIEPCTSEEFEEWESKESDLKLLADGDGAIISIGSIPMSVFKILKGHGANMKESFEDLLDQLVSIKKCNSMYDGVENNIVSLESSCDEFELLHCNKNNIEAGVKITMPYVYTGLLTIGNLNAGAYSHHN